ncbi:MAG: vitamin K epoxide reductase family protein [Polyangia bacterium]
MNRNRKILLAICALALIGALVAAYDFTSRMLGIPLFCPFAGNGCDIVQNSPYAVILGIPLSFLGILGFGAYVLAAYLGIRSTLGAHWHLYALATWSLFQIASMAYFSYLELTVIHAVCSICVFVLALHVAIAVMIAYAIRTTQGDARVVVSQVESA